MAGYRVATSNFTKGWISPEAQARFELPVYNAAVRKAINVKVQRTGGLKKRMGTRFVAEALSSSSHLFPFQFSDQQAYVLEMAQEKMRPLALGGSLLETGLKVTAITKAANAKVTAAYHGYKAGDQVYLSGIKGMLQINDRFLTVVSVIDANNFTVNFNSTSASTFTGDTAGGTVNTAPPPVVVPPPPTPVPTPSPPPIPVGSGSGGGYTSGGTGPIIQPTLPPPDWDFGDIVWEFLP